MNVIFALLAGIAIGGGLVGWWLSKRWLNQVQEAERNLADIAEQHKQTSQTNRELKQKVADLQFQLNQAHNDLRSRS